MRLSASVVSLLLGYLVMCVRPRKCESGRNFAGAGSSGPSGMEEGVIQYVRMRAWFWARAAARARGNRWGGAPENRVQRSARLTLPLVACQRAGHLVRTRLALFFAAVSRSSVGHRERLRACSVERNGWALELIRLGVLRIRHHRPGSFWTQDDACVCVLCAAACWFVSPRRIQLQPQPLTFNRTGRTSPFSNVELPPRLYALSAEGQTETSGLWDMVFRETRGHWSVPAFADAARCVASNGNLHSDDIRYLAFSPQQLRYMTVLMPSSALSARLLATAGASFLACAKLRTLALAFRWMERTPPPRQRSSPPSTTPSLHPPSADLLLISPWFGFSFLGELVAADVGFPGYRGLSALSSLSLLRVVETLKQPTHDRFRPGPVALVPMPWPLFIRGEMYLLRLAPGPRPRWRRRGRVPPRLQIRAPRSAAVMNHRLADPEVCMTSACPPRHYGRSQQAASRSPAFFHRREHRAGVKPSSHRYNPSNETIQIWFRRILANPPSPSPSARGAMAAIPKFTRRGPREGMGGEPLPSVIDSPRKLLDVIDWH
nr:unnamed protein product [Digitaria exilis]